MRDHYNVQLSGSRFPLGVGRYHRANNIQQDEGCHIHLPLKDEILECTTTWGK
jgi:hypothetical protein